MGLPVADVNPRLAKELQATVAAEKNALRLLSLTYAKLEKDLKSWERKVGPGAAVKRGQARLLQHVLRRRIGELFKSIGDDVQATKLAAASVAAQPEKEILDYFRAAGISGKDLKSLSRSVGLAAEQTIETAMKRIQGDSYRPLSSRVYHAEAWVNDKLDDVINTTLLSGINAADLSKAVRGFVRPDTRGGVRYAAQRLARTEINNAFHASSIQSMEAEPFTKAIKWNLSGSHPVPDKCNEYAEKQHYSGGDAGVYRKSEVPARPHPNCLCYTTGVEMGRDEFIQSFRHGDFDDWLQENGVDPGGH